MGATPLTDVSSTSETTAREPLANAAPLAFARTVPCINCAYDLKGLPIDGPCPECGQAARRSLGSLWCAEAASLARISSGATMGALGGIIGPAMLGGMFVLNLRSDRTPGLVILALGGPVLSLIGHLQMASAITPADERILRFADFPADADTGLRRTSIVYFVIAVACAGLFVLARNVPRTGGEYTVMMAAAELAAVIVMVGAAAVWGLRVAFACRRMARLTAAARWNSVGTIMGGVLCAVAGVLPLPWLMSGGDGVFMLLTYGLAICAGVLLSVLVIANPVRLAFFARTMGKVARAVRNTGPLLGEVESRHPPAVGPVPRN